MTYTAFQRFQLDALSESTEPQSKAVSALCKKMMSCFARLTHA